MGKSVRCPKCKQPFRVGEAPVEKAGFANLDFDESRTDTSQPAEFDEPTAPSTMWAAPTREVAVVKSKPALSKEDAARLQSRREYSLLIVGGAVCGVLALGVIIVGTVVVWRSIEKNASETATENPSSASSEANDSGGAGNATLPTLFGFDETRRALMVDYLVSQGCGKPKAKLTMAMVVNALKKLGADFNIQPGPEFPEQLELLRERVVMRDVPVELLKSDKVPKVFETMIEEYQSKSLGPAEEEVAILVLLAFLGAEM